MTNEITTVFEPIDLCACFDMIFDPPIAVIREWEDAWNEQFIANKERGYYVTELDGTLYYYNGNTRTRVSEFFSPNGQSMNALIENVVRFAAGSTVSTKIPMNC